MRRRGRRDRSVIGDICAVEVEVVVKLNFQLGRIGDDGAAIRFTATVLVRLLIHEFVLVEK